MAAALIDWHMFFQWYGTWLSLVRTVLLSELSLPYQAFPAPLDVPAK